MSPCSLRATVGTACGSGTLSGVELRSGEQALYEGRPSWRALGSFYAGGFIAAALLLLIIGWLADSWALAAILAAIIVGLTLIVGYVRRIATKYLITTQRLRITRGIVRRSVQETRLDRVQNVNYRQTVLDRLFHVGNVDFDTAGTDDSEFRFEWVNGPEKVVRAVDEAIHEAGPASRSPTPGSPPGA
jgi:membrane protein YdbS with pleckstrin-like domain